MPFTPFHMGPGILIKAVLQGSFSLIVFGWSQIVMDLQPLFAILTGRGEYHGFTHTYVGATLIGAFSTLTGKYLAGLALVRVLGKHRRDIAVTWWVAGLSAFIGTYSHIVLDSIVHADMQPLYPFSPSNHLLHLLSWGSAHKVCVVAGIVGAAIYFAAVLLRSSRRRAIARDAVDQRR